MPRRIALFVAVLAAFAVPAIAVAHELDHPAPMLNPGSPPPTGAISGGRGAHWDFVRTITTGNPHTDLDFFTQNGETYMSVGTLAVGPNNAGQNIIRLTRNRGRTVDPRLLSGHPSATCITDPSAALGLQHDVEATPKGRGILNTRNRFADRRGAQLLLDATDNPGRCHDQGVLGLIDAPNGGLEIIDITDIENPVEIGLTSHIGEAHTVNVDPKRPHIAYAVSSDAVSVSNGKRENEDPDDSDRFDLDGWEVVDLSSCMNFPAGTTVAQKRAACNPQVYRYRYPRMQMALGHTLKNSVYGCHELELYPDDRLTCGGGNAAMVFDMKKAFDDRGTPRNFRDDKPRGTPLPCRRRASTSEPPFTTGAMVIDCVQGAGGQDLTVPGWINIGRPSLTGVRWLGSVHHMGRGAGGAVNPAYDATQDIDFNHETEFTGSRKFLLATDERGGGVVPPGATCSSIANNRAGNGGLHAYATARIRKPGQRFPRTAREAWRAYARTPKGAKAIYRARIRTVAEPTVCTAHVFQQVPGQNRIFMGWYSQGTQVVDFVEHRNGRFSFREAGFFIPTNANTWTSHVFKVRKNRNGSFTYWGATGDFLLAGRGRNSVDIYRVTLPAPPRAAQRPRARPRPRFTG